MKDREFALKMGSAVRELRLEAGVSQETFADKCGLHRTYIGSIERGEKTVTIETLRKITTALNMPLSRFFAC